MIGCEINWKAVISFIIIVLVGLACVIYYGIMGSANKVEKEEDYVLEFYFGGSEDVEVRYYPKTSKTVLYRNGQEGEVLSRVNKVALDVLKLEENTGVSNTLLNRDTISELTYDSTLTESSQYINFLYSKGYKLKREVRTPQYMDFILDSSEGSKRLLVFTQTIMVGDLDKGAELPPLEDYIKNYRK